MKRINYPVLLFSFLISVITWMTLYGDNFAMNVSVPIRLNNDNTVALPHNLHVDTIDNIKLQLAGPTGQVGRAEQNVNLAKLITIDLSAAHEGTDQYPITFDSSIRSLVQGPFTARVKVEEIIQKSVPVKVELRGSLSDPTVSLASYPTTDSTVTVTGPKSVVNLVTEARALLQVDQIDINAAKSEVAPLAAVGSDGRFYENVELNPDRTRITPIITAANVSKTVIVSPSIVGTPAAGYSATDYQVKPTQIQLTGPGSILINVNSVKTETIDVSNLTASKQFKIKIVIPRGTKIIGKGDRSAVATVRYLVAKDPSATPPSSSGISKTPVPAGGVEPAAGTAGGNH